jgi:AtzE family amidohydrolase
VTATAAEIAGDVRAGRTSAVKVVEDALEKIRRLDAELNCFTAVLADEALAAARAVDAEVRAMRDPGPLAGVPFAVKNLFDIKGVVTLAGSIIEADKPAATEDAPLVARLRAAGAILLGALNMDEYAYGFTTENAHYGPTRNPHDPSRVAGGSSGGSAAAVAAGFVPLTLGSDTNGSIRVPAAFCGVFGLKPTFGRLSRRGVTPFVHSLDHVGPFARSVEDLALAYDVCQGPDPADPDCANRAAASVIPELTVSSLDLRVGVLDGWFTDTARPDVCEALAAVAETLKATAGASMTGAKTARAAAFCITASEGGALHLENLRARPGDFDPATRDRLIAGAMEPARFVANAHRFRALFLAQVLELFGQFDVLIAPTTPFSAPRIGQPTIELGGAEVSVRANAGVYTQPLSFIGLPVMSVPVRTSHPMPLGVQLIAPPWREDLLFRIAARLERDGAVGVKAPACLRQAAQ